MLRKVILFVWLFLVIKLSFSQAWCYPGAKWHFTHYHVAASMITRLTYVKDTIMFGKNCNKIEYYTQGVGMFGPLAALGPHFYTYQNGSVVYILDVWGSTNNFDTLYNFGANIGDSWYMAPKSLATCANSKITVTDTGHVMIQSQYLKWQKVNILAVNFSTPVLYSDTIFERIGCVSNYIYYPQDICRSLIDSEKGGPLRCYEDNQIVGYKRTTAACNPYSTTAINEMESRTNISLHPNPSKDRVIIVSESYLRENAEIEIKDCLGQSVFNDKFENEIDVSFLSNGVYILQVTEGNHLAASKRLVIAK